jgi:catechol 2,3-dioxygenase-like lactoylglutathione lyase family enzyme
MTVRRIVPDIAATDAHAGTAFFTEVLGLEMVMDLGWIVTFASTSNRTAQINVQSPTAVPKVDYSVEVADLDACYEKAKALGYRIVYPLTTESWPVRRFFVEDPHGKIANIMTHI